MTTRPQATLLPDGRRLHLHHGPIDLIIEVVGAPKRAAYARAVARFDTLLEGLVAELDALRRPLDGQGFVDPVARRMARAVAPFSECFVTPMAAVAGAVADEMLAALVADDPPPKAYVNNGGDIAFHLEPGQATSFLGPAGKVDISADSSIRGVATSGWHGRSHSLGIADAVTVSAETAASADVAATLIANAVDLPGHLNITRVPASQLSPDSDLGCRLVTTDVGVLSQTDVRTALARGTRLAERFLHRAHISFAELRLRDQFSTISPTKKALIHG